MALSCKHLVKEFSCVCVLGGCLNCRVGYKHYTNGFSPHGRQRTTRTDPAEELLFQANCASLYWPLNDDCCRNEQQIRLGDQIMELFVMISIIKLHDFLHCHQQKCII